MLTEHFIASVGVPAKPPSTNVAKDAAIFYHEFQPLSQQRAVFKKSASPPNCLAVSDKHIFAGQTDKGVVHVYNRDKGNLEAVVPFTEKISSLVLACDDSILVLGTTEGRIFLWETTSGRQVTTPQTHLQAVTALAVDPTSNFLLSASKDSTVHVWSIPALLSFTSSAGVAPLRTFSSHRSAISAITVGRSTSSCNYAVSISKDKTCLVWDYRTNNILRTHLLPAVPLSVSMDPADRAIYVGYDDGSLQNLDLFVSSSGTLDAVQNANNATEPVQPPPSTRWKPPGDTHGSTLSLSVSFDGSTVISGHQSGSVLSWDVARGAFVTALTQQPLPGPVHNLTFLPATGFHGIKAPKCIQIHEVIKPKFGAFDTGEDGNIPGNYTVNVQLLTDLGSARGTSSFQSALTASSFTTEILDQGLTELATWGNSAKSKTDGHSEMDEDGFMRLDDSSLQANTPSLKDENTSLRLQLEALKRVQKKSFEKLERLNEERRALMQREQSRLARGKGQKLKSKINGSKEISSDEDME